LLPQVEGSVSEGLRRDNLATILGKPAPPGIALNRGFQVVQGGASASVPIFDVSLWSRYKASGYAVHSAAEQRVGVREQTVLLVVSQYLRCLRASARVEAAHSRVDLAEALYKLASDRQASGAGTKLDALRANVELKNEKQGLIVAETLLDTSLYGLSRLLHLDPAQPIELADRMNYSDLPPTDLNKDLSQAYQDRPEMKSLADREEQLSLDKRAARASRLPKLAASGAWSYTGLRPSEAIPVHEYAATLSIPLFTGGRIKAEIAKSDLALKTLAQQQQDLRDRIALEVKTASAQLDSARHEVEVANSGIALAKEEVTQARDRFQAGVANNIEVITAQDELSRSSDNQIDALYRFNQARADLAHATGQIEALYSK
jgi:outer membrane protein TolC